MFPPFEKNANSAAIFSKPWRGGGRLLGFIPCAKWVVDGWETLVEANRRSYDGDMMHRLPY